MDEIYEIEGGYWTGRKSEIGEEDGAPSGWTRKAPPEVSGSIERPWVDKAENRPEVIALPISPDQVDAERDRRIDAGFTFNGKAYQTRQTDRENIAGAAQIAFMAIVGGAEAGNLRWADPDSDYVWIASDNSLVPMDAQTVVELGRAAAAEKQALIFAARTLKDMDPIPADYTDDKWWP